MRDNNRIIGNSYSGKSMGAENAMVYLIYGKVKKINLMVYILFHTKYKYGAL